MTTHIGQKIYIRIDPVQIGTELLDYFKVNIMDVDPVRQNLMMMKTYHLSTIPILHSFLIELYLRPNLIVPRFRTTMLVIKYRPTLFVLRLIIHFLQT